MATSSARLSPTGSARPSMAATRSRPGFRQAALVVARPISACAKTWSASLTHGSCDEREPVEPLRHGAGRRRVDRDRSEEHTSELQSLLRTSYAVFCLKKQITQAT